MNNRAIIYARLSREDEDRVYGRDVKSESRSIENQISFLTNYAKENNFKVVAVYYDDGVSGGTFDRPGLNRVMDDMRERKFDILLIKDFSRLGRKMYKVGELIEEIFPRNGIRVIAPNDDYDSEKYSSPESIVLKNFLNDYYLKEAIKKSRLVWKFNAHHKHINFYPKYGYNFDADRNEIIDEYSAGIVRKIFQYALDGMSTPNIAKELNRQGVLSRSHYQTQVLGLKALNKNTTSEWNGEKVWEILKDYEYCGHSINLLKSERVLLKNTHLAIINEDTFKAVQEKIYARSTNKNKLNHLGKIIIDKNTGHHLAYIRRVKESYKAYCLRIYKSDLGRSITYYAINADGLEDVVYKDLLKVIAKCYEDKDKFYQSAKNKIIGKNENLEDLQQKANKLNEEFADLLEKLLCGKISEAIYSAKSKTLNDKLQSIQKRIESAEQQAEKIALFELRFSRFVDELKNKPTNKIDFIKRFVRKIYIDNVKNKTYTIRIVYKYEA